MLVFLCVVTVAYLVPRVDRGWIPHDEGTLGLAAVRVLDGEVPHRDFDEPYTGGLSLLHAAAFSLLGEDLVSLRWLLFAASLAFVPAVYRIARRLASPAVSALVALTALAWSVPNYFASLPSWYNLFFAVFGILALLRHFETGSRMVLVTAGLCGGVSILFKTIGAYFVAAALLFLVYREQSQASAGPRGRSLAIQVPVVVGVGGIAAAAALLVVPSGGPMEIFYFVVPVSALVVEVLRREWGLRGVSAVGRWSRLFGSIAPFAAGVSAPLAIFFIVMSATADFGHLWSDLVFQPGRRLDHVTFPLPDPRGLIVLLPVGIVLLLPHLRRARISPVVGVVAAGGALVILAIAGGNPFAYRVIWSSAQLANPVIVLVAIALLAAGRIEGTRAAVTFLLTAMAAWIGFVQFPYAFGVYFCYVAPVPILASLAVVASARDVGRVPAAALVFYLLFAIVWLNRGYVRDMGWRYTWLPQDTPVGVEGASLRVEPWAAERYQRIVSEIQRRSAPGSYIYASPDCPEIYFLARRRNPTRSFFDLFDHDWNDPRARRERILELVDARDVRVIVLGWGGDFSTGVPRDLAEALLERFPERAIVPPFTIAWRGGGSTR